MAEPEAAPAFAAKPAKPAPRQIGQRGQSKRPAKAQEFIVSLLEQGKPLLTAQLNAAWQKAKRAGRANKTLGLLVKGKKLKRVKVPGQRGSAYTLASGDLPAHAVVTSAVKTAAKPAPRQMGKRGQFAQTAEEMILSLLEGRKALTTRELAVAWKKAGRGGAVDNPLGRLVKAKKLKRTRLAGQRGSAYSVR